MIREFKGTSELARLAAALPIRARACLALFATEIGLTHLGQSPDLPLARVPLNFARTWHSGEVVDLDELEEVIEAEEISLSYVAARARDRNKEEFLAWCVVANAIHYVAYHAFRAAGRRPWSSLSNIDETVLDTIDEDLRALEPSAMARMAKAWAFLRKFPDVTILQLNAHMSKP